MIRFVCECGKQLQAREENAGKLALCPSCQRHVTVPDPSAISHETEEPLPSRERVQRDRPLPRDDSETASETDERRHPQPEGSSVKATMSLVLGILAIFCNVLTGVPAVIYGILALRDISRSRDRLTGRGLATAGIISASVGTLLSCVIGVVLLLPALLLPAVSRVREAADRAQSQNNLKQLSLALLNYSDVNFGRLPVAAICDKDGKPLLSWRVAILPYVEQQLLYSQFKLDEPWDGPHNSRLLARMPAVYKLSAGLPGPTDDTPYQVFVGNGAAFDKTRSHHIPADFPDGLANTILIVEAANAVPWTKPEDIPFDPNKPLLPLLNTSSRRGFAVAMADGSVRLVAPQISETTLKAAITRNGHDAFGSDW